MSAEAAGRTDHETPVDAVFEKGAICKDENENMKLCYGEASLNDGFSQSYMKTLTSLSLNTAIRGPKFYCYECDYYLHTLLSMTTHMKMHRKPFCPICFRMFCDEIVVDAHIAEIHSTLFPNGIVRPLFRLGEAGETEVPPNSPTQEYRARSIQNNGLGTINSTSISLLIVEKLRQHQKKLNLSVESKRHMKTPHQHEPVDEPVSRKTRKTRNYRKERERLISISGATGKVQKGTKPKLATSRISDANSAEDTAETSLKRLTSRFGRVISLKVPQF
uniref:C2H2-type domain-containing protein n=1 Tax=Anopheles funestus TaxID=62324 RepID=A0A182RC77_ANOFN